jgi:hypothetical protein
LRSRSRKDSSIILVAPELHARRLYGSGWLRLWKIRRRSSIVFFLPTAETIKHCLWKKKLLRICCKKLNRFHCSVKENFLLGNEVIRGVSSGHILYLIPCFRRVQYCNSKLKITEIFCLFSIVILKEKIKEILKGQFHEMVVDMRLWSSRLGLN